MNRVSYRQLQLCAKALKLPGNMKYQVLWDMVSARKAGNERRVEQLMAEQNRLRFERRMNRKVARTLKDDNLRLAQLAAHNDSNTTSTTACNNNHLSNGPVDGNTAQEILIDTLGQVVPQASDQTPHTEWDSSRDLLMVHLLDTKIRHKVMAREIEEYRKAAKLLPVYKPKGPSDQYPHYQFAPVTPLCTSYVPNSEPLVPLARQDSIQGYAPVGHRACGPSMSQMTGGPNYEHKQAEESCGREMRCYQIEGVIEPVPSTSYVPGYTIGQYSSGQYYTQVAEDHFAQYKMFDHEGYQLKHSGLPNHNVKNQTSYPYTAVVSPDSDTQSAYELGMEMTFEDEQYADFEPYIEEVISSQPFDPDQSLPPSQTFKSEETVVETSDSAEDTDERIIVEIGSEPANQNNSFTIKKERTEPNNQDEENSQSERGNTETEAPGAPLTSSELCPTSDSKDRGIQADSPQPDTVDDQDTCDGPSSPDGELEIVLPEEVDDADVPADDGDVPAEYSNVPAEDSKPGSSFK